MNQSIGQHVPSFFDQVNAWHVRMGLPARTEGQRPHFLSVKDFNYRTHLFFEEFREFMLAHENGSIIDTADALGDMLWVICGTAAMMGLPLNEIFAEIAKSNNLKRPWQEGDPVKPRADMSNEIAKPKDWRPPDLHQVLMDHAS